MNYECPQSVTKVKTSGSVWPTAGDSEGWRHYPELREVRPTSASYTPPHPGPRSCRVWPHSTGVRCSGRVIVQIECEAWGRVVAECRAAGGSDGLSFTAEWRVESGDWRVVTT